MKHSCPVMHKRLESLTRDELAEHVSYYKGTETGDVAKHLLDKTAVKEQTLFEKMDTNKNGRLTKKEVEDFAKKDK